MALVENRLQLRYIADQGTFVANGASTVTVASTRITATSVVSISLNTVGGTISVAPPFLFTLTAGTGFGVRSTASDTSTYNYVVWNK